MHNLNIPVIDIFVVIVNWNTAEILSECLQSIQQSTKSILYKICVVDNGSTDGSVEMVSEHFPEVLLISNKMNRGYAKANNQGISIARGRYVLLLNSDTIIPFGALDQLVAVANKFGERLGVLAPRLKEADGHIQNSIASFPSLTKGLITHLPFSDIVIPKRIIDHYSIQAEKCNCPCEVDYASGACLLVSKEAIDQVGGLDEDYFMYGEDIDLCYSLRQAGWSVIYYPDIEIIHLGNQSGKEKWGSSRLAVQRFSERMFYMKSYGWLAATIFQTILISRSLIYFVKHKLLYKLSSSLNQAENHRQQAEMHLLVILVSLGVRTPSTI
jgi:GT2 family glycosyltransferase